MLLQLAAELAPAIARKLSMFVLRAAPADAGEKSPRSGLAGPRLAEVLAALGLTLPQQAMQSSGGEVRVIRIGSRLMLITAAEGRARAGAADRRRCRGRPAPSPGAIWTSWPASR